YTTGGSATGATVTGLPGGVSALYTAATNTLKISGTPTASGTYNYAVTTLGPCGNNSLNGTITVTANATISFASAGATSTQTVCINNAITAIKYSVGSGGIGAAVTGLPAGVTGSYNAGVFTITGAPSVSGTFNYTVTTIGSCANSSLGGSITVNPNSTIT